jgi:protein-tyrosine phosphatase
MIDLHSHLLWGVDDGPSSLDDAREMLDVYIRLGYAEVVCTPHLYHPGFPPLDRGILMDHFHSLAEMGAESGLRIRLGGEYYFSTELVETTATVPKDLYLIRNRYMLLETGGFSNLTLLGNFFFRLQLGQIVPILAHPERIAIGEHQWPRLARLRECGCLFQVSAGSLSGQEGGNIQRTAFRLIEEDLATFVASDAHSADDLAVSVPAATAAAKRRFGEDTTRRLFVEKPAEVMLASPEDPS